MSPNRLNRLDSAPSGPLQGIRVVDLTINVLGPLATQIMGDMGADVIKVETPQGDAMRQNGPTRSPGMAAFFLNINRNKRSIVLDLRRPAGKEALMRLAKTADVFVHSLRPGSAERLGIDYAAISASNPRVVYACAPGYRSDGPNRDRPAFDDVIQGESGITGMTGLATGTPRYFPMIVADKMCGVVLASSISMALFYRERTGEGQEVQVPMLETLLSFNLVEHLAEGSYDPPLPGGMGYDRVLSPHRRPYVTKDGYICLMAVSDEQWQRLFAALERPDLARDERFAGLAQRGAHIDALYEQVSESISRRTTAEWRERLDAADIPNGPANALADLPTDPYLVATGFFRHYDHPTEGPLVTTDIPVRFSRSPGAHHLPTPTLGEHTRPILAELGYDEAAIADLTGLPSNRTANER